MIQIRNSEKVGVTIRDNFIIAPEPSSADQRAIQILGDNHSGVEIVNNTVTYAPTRWYHLRAWFRLCRAIHDHCKRLSASNA
jgi:hypothetical protein